MSNKISIATIQFRADAKGVNPALDAIRQASKDAHNEVDRLQDALDHGIKKMKDANGIEFNVAESLAAAKREAKSFDAAIRELTKGATALEAVWKNIEMGTIEKNSRAELKGAINAAQSRLRSIREMQEDGTIDEESLQRQRELNVLITESQKQLNNLDRDTQKFIETLEKGEAVSEATINKEIKGLKDMLALIPYGTEEWNKYNAQLTKAQELVAGIRKQELASSAKILGDQNLGQYNEADIKKAIDAARELIKTYETGSTEAQQIAQFIVRAEEHLKNYGVEAERAARKQAAAEEEAKRKIQEKLDMMTQRMGDVSKLTDSALQETKRYWEEQVAGAERGSSEAQKYEAYIKQIADEQQRIANERTAKTAQGIFGDLGSMSEKEIRASIEAARQLQQTLSVTDDEYQQISKAIVNAEEHIKKYGIEAERAARKEQAAQEEAARKLQEKNDMMLQRMQDLGSLTKEGLEETKKFWEAQMTGAQRGSDEAQRYATFIKAITAEQEYLARVQAREGAMKLQTGDVTMSEGEMRKAIEDAKKYLQTLSMTDDEYKTIAGSIVAAEEYIKRFGMEAERSTMLAEMKMDEMNKRMADLPKLSDAALQETKKFWEEQLSGAERGSTEAKKYEDNIKAIAKLQEQIAADRTKTTAQGIYGNLNTMGEKEIRAAIDAARQYQQMLSLNNDEYQRLSQAIVNAEEYIKNYGIEAERAYRKEQAAQEEAARKLQEKMDMMTARMGDVSRLTDATLAETKKYWEQQLVGVERNSDAATTYEDHIRTIIKEQERLANIQNQQSAQKLFGELNTMSEQNIRAAIDAARKYQQTLSVTDDEYQNLSRAIVNAEEHIKEYGIEAERAARKEVAAAEEAARKRWEADEQMRQQLRNTSQLTATALKAQEQYWRKLIDDPKTAAESVEEYKKDLEQVHQLQQQMIQEQGREALNFFTSGQSADATGDEIKKRAEALKAYQGTLHQMTDASDIAEIDRILKSLKDNADAAKGELMSLAEAMEIVDKVDFDPDGKLNFEGTTEQLIGAKNALEKELAVVQRGSARYQELRDKVDKLNAAIENTRINQAQVDAILANPKTASYDQLKMAIDAARKRLNSMRRDTSEQKKAFEELAKSIKQADIEMKALGNSSKGTASAFDKAWSRLKTYVGLYVGAAVAMQKLTATMGDLMELSDKMGEVRKTTGFTADEVGRLSANLKKMDVRTSLVSLLEISASAGQLGLKTIEDVQGFTEAANKLMIALPEMGKEAATEMMRVAIATGEVDKIRKQLQEGTVEGSSATAVAMEKIASTIDRLRASSASTAPEITDFVKRVGAVGAQSGITIDQVAALGSTVSSLGMRVEMSATALSRMIPAIRRNAFDVAKAIGMAPEALRQMFDEAGGGMNAMLAIFQHIKDSGMDEESIEKMLGMGDMAEIMKELNQQGARAGIVFAGLSQNVDELRRQLGTASQAYEENVAIQQEFERMNETTAAKWERLKNQLEEYFIGDSAQTWLGNIIDGLRTIIDLITGPLSGAFNAFLLSFGAFKLGVGAMGWKFILGPIWETITGTRQLGASIAALKTKWIAAWKAMDAATKANWILAIGAALYELGTWAWDAMTKVSALDKALADLDNETDDAVRHVGRLVTAFNDSSVKAEAASKKQEELKAQTEALSKEVDELKKKTDQGAESTGILTKKQAELEEKEKELKDATDESNKANQARLNLISELNSKYSTYLGYMLSEKTAAEEVASAHQLIVAALKEERKQKGLNALHDAVDKEYADDIKEYAENSQEELSGIASDARRRIMDQWRRVLTAVTPDTKNGGFTLSEVNGVTKGGTYGSEAELKAAMRNALREIIKTEAGGANDRIKVSTWVGTKYKSLDDYLDDVWGGGTDDGFGDWAETYIKRERDIAQATHDNQVEVDQAHQERIKSAVENQRTNLQNLRELAKDNNAFTDDQIRQMAQEVNALVAGFDQFGEELSGGDEIFGKDKERTLQNAVNNVLANLDVKTRGRIFRVAQRGQKSTNGTGNVPVPSGNSIWGNTPAADSTDYSTWDVNELVARRNQMDKFKNVLKDGVDVKTVLAEDKALMKALQNGLSSDWKSVMGWYNQERLKIQQELKSERFSTNLGHWRDDPKSKKRTNPLVESDYALAELDRYYAKRKEQLEKAREEENMSEELYNRQVELLEQEHLKKRSDLRRTFTADNSKEEQAMVAQFREWWSALEKSGDLDKVPWATVESEWAKATAAQIGRNNLKAQQDLTQLQSITVKHLNAIAKLVDKERPYDGITANLRKNLTEMDILLADMVEQGPTADTAKLMKEQTARLKFLLGEAENAYALTFDDIKKRAEEQGWGDWIKALEVDEQKKQSLMQNLRNVYDQIQEAIKKESSIIKKQLEIQWNDLLPGSDMSMKGVFEKAISDLGLEGDRVKRANSLIGSGAASERVADKLAIKQMQVQLDMQQTYFALMQKIGDERVRQLQLSAKANEQAAKELRLKEQQLRAEGKTAEADVVSLKAQNAERQALQDSFDAEHAQKSLNLAKTKELAEEEKQRVAIANQLEESQNRLYTSLREWADLLASSVQSLFEAEHAGDAEYYNERAKLDLTGKGGLGAGTYIVIDDEGTSDARAHYEYLDERQALERQHEIEQENARAEAWRKVMDEFNQKMNDQITDWINQGAQQAALDMNSEAVDENTNAITGLTGAINNLTGNLSINNAQQAARQNSGTNEPNPTIERIGYEDITPVKTTTTETTTTQTEQTSPFLPGVTPGISWVLPDDMVAAEQEQLNQRVQMQQEAAEKVRIVNEESFHKIQRTTQDTNKTMVSSAQSSFAKMALAANLYGVAYQAMSNDNLSATQKFEMIALQSVGNFAISSLTAFMSKAVAEGAVNEATVLGKLWSQLGWAAAPVFAIFTGLLGAAMGAATSAVSKSKSQIAQATGSSVGAGRLATGMLKYASGNINEFSDPNSLTPGRSYNVDAADGKTYRAKYTGKNPRTHITNGPEFHLVGEAGREAIIDAHTTRLIQQDDTGIWQAIQTLYNGGSISAVRRGRNVGRGVRAFAEGNIDEFEDAMGGYDIATDSTGGGMSMEMAVALQASLDRQSDLLERALTDGIHAKFDVYGKGGLIDSYDTGKKTVNRHGERY